MNIFWSGAFRAFDRRRKSEVKHKFNNEVHKYNNELRIIQCQDGSAGRF